MNPIIQMALAELGKPGLARAGVAFAAIAWMAFGLFIAEPGWVCLPLYGLYPGDVSVGQAGAHSFAWWIWGVGAALVFFALALLALGRKNSWAAAAFIALLLLSTYLGLARAA